PRTRASPAPISPTAPPVSGCACSCRPSRSGRASGWASSARRLPRPAPVPSPSESTPPRRVSGPVRFTEEDPMPTSSLPFPSFALALALGLAVAALPATRAGAADVANGKVLYQQNCVSCHGESGKGDGPTGQALAATGTPPRDFTKADFKFDAD